MYYIENNASHDHGFYENPQTRRGKSNEHCGAQCFDGSVGNHMGIGYHLQNYYLKFQRSYKKRFKFSICSRT